MTEPAPDPLKKIVYGNLRSVNQEIELGKM